MAQAFAALGFIFATGGVGAGLLELGFEAANMCLKRTRVDLEQDVAFLFLRFFGEGDLIDLA